ncbi:MAG TPA: hypothetical protein VGJ26_00430 [Pirellulales bacterium]|jgi:hypothetical protein
MSFLVAAVVFACSFGGAILGMILRSILPDAHLSSESKDVVKVATGLVATMAALVLGLLVASAKSAFDSQKSGFHEMATNLMLLDRTLAHYGPDAAGTRKTLRDTTAAALDHLWPPEGHTSGFGDHKLTTRGEVLYNSIRELNPQDDEHRAMQAEALTIGASLARTRWQLSQQDDNSNSKPFMIVLIFWLSVIFLSFGLFSPANPTTITALLVCALSVSGAILLIVDLDQPFEGLIRVSDKPLRYALEQLGQ